MVPHISQLDIHQLFVLSCCFKEISINNIVNKGCEVVRLRYTGVNQLHGSRAKRKGIEMMRGKDVYWIIKTQYAGFICPLLSSVVVCSKKSFYT